MRIVDHARLDEREARREAEDARALIEAQNAQLRELDRLKDEFVSSVSHELRTPLTSITGYVELLLDEVEDEQTRAHLRVVERNAGRLLALVSDLLFAARLQSGHLELSRDPVDLAELVADTVESARPRAEAGGVELRVTAGAIPPVEGERDRLGQLFDNLVSNAIKFTPAGGTRRDHARVRRRAAAPRSRSPTPGSASPRPTASASSSASSARRRCSSATSPAPGSASTSRRRSSRPTAAGSRSAAGRARGRRSSSSSPASASTDQPLLAVAVAEAAHRLDRARSRERPGTSFRRR